MSRLTLRPPNYPQYEPVPDDSDLLDLVFVALDHGISSLSVAGEEPFTPFLLTHDESGRRLMRFVADTYEGSIAAARSHAATLPQSAQMAALAFDGFVTMEGVRSDAVVVQAQRRGSRNSSIYFQRYRREGSRIVEVGNAVGPTENDKLL
jgi:hypothetical protein